MRIHAESVIPHPLSRVFSTYRDELPAIAAHIPDVQEIRVADRRASGDTVDLHNVWIAEREIPAFAGKLITPEMLRWDDYASWNAADRSCTWRLETRMFTEAVRCGGRNRFEDLGDGTTRLTLSGELEIDLRRIPGVPRLLAGRLAPQVERFIVALITPNLERTNEALARYLDETSA